MGKGFTPHPPPPPPVQGWTQKKHKTITREYLISRKVKRHISRFWEEIRTGLYYISRFFLSFT